MKNRLYWMLRKASMLGKALGLQNITLLRRVYYPFRDYLASETMTMDYEGYDLCHEPGMPNRQVKLTGIHEPEIISVINRHTSRGDTVLDIGGYIGYHTLTLRKSVGSEGYVIAFEPDPNNAALLKQSISLNNLTNVRVEQLALGSTTEQVELSISDEGPSLPTTVKTYQDAERISVKSTSLSHYLENNKLSDVSFAKIDVEGGEYDILCEDDGFQNIDTMVVEIHEGMLTKYQIEEIIDTLSKFGQVEVIAGGEIKDKTGNFHILYQRNKHR